jgi:spermidine synthase
MTRSVPGKPVRSDVAGAGPESDARAVTARLWVAGALLFLSGAAGLLYQVLWVKQLSLIVGVEVYSITIAVSAFFAGLAAGNIFFGRWADRLSMPVRLYAALEAAVAIAGVGVTVLLAHTAGAFAWLAEHAGPLAWLLPFALVGAPAFLMGGTLPALVRTVTGERESVSKRGGFLYALNTAGGVAGALLSSFVLIRAVGVRGSSVVAAVLNLMAATGALMILRAPVKAAEERAFRPTEVTYIFPLILYGAAGGIALGYEIVWSQSIVQFMSTRVFAFSIVLATYLFGIFLGSWLGARYVDRVKDKWGMFAVLVAAAGVVALMEVWVMGAWEFRMQAVVANAIGSATKSLMLFMCVRFLLAALSVVFVPTLLLGAAFPFALSICRDESGAGHGVGAVLGWNTVGGVVGTLLTGFVLVPRVGLVLSLVILAGAALVVAAAALRRSTRAVMTRMVAVLGVVFVVCAFVVPSNKWANLLTDEHPGRLVFYEESNGGAVAVIGQAASANRFRRLYIDGVSNSGDAMTSLRYMRLQALLPLIVHAGEPSSALVIGLGTGITAGALTQYPGMTEIRCAELLPAVVKASENFEGNFDAAKNAAVHITLRDGREELLRNQTKYDLITLEPPPPSAEGVANLYSTEFYRLAGARLNHNGIVAQWLPLPTQNDEDTKALVRSFIEVFPYASLWTTELHEMLMVGSMEPMPLDARQIAERYYAPKVEAALAEVGVESPEELLALWVTDRGGMMRYAGTTPAVTDDGPRVEYSTWVRPLEILTTLPELQALRVEAPLAGTEEMRAKVKMERDGLDDFYAAGLAAYVGDREAWGMHMKRVMQEKGGNQYYLWIAGSN